MVLSDEEIENAKAIKETETQLKKTTSTTTYG